MSTIYSESIPGTQCNYGWPVKFEKDRGYVRIAQEHPDGDEPTETVLLSPRQLEALFRFVHPRKWG